jgi:tetratricopeptide (TPR) repeat protein
MFLVTQHRFEEAVAPLRAAVAADSTFPEATLFLGYALVETGRFAEGLAALDRARRLGRDTPELRLNRGRALLGLNRYPEAEAQYQECRLQEPANPAFPYYLGLIRLGMGQPAAADSLFRLAVRLGPADNPDLDAARGKALLELGRDAEAERFLSEALSRAPRNASLGILHGFALYRLNRIEEARAELRRVLEIDPGNDQARRYLEALPPR